jgi:large subunit ribosomal protein L9
MKIILLEDDKIQNVSDGYARNYLLPRGLAITATPAAITAVEKRKEKKLAEIEARKKTMQATADQLSALEVTITADVGEGGKLFGSVTTNDIARAIKQSAGIDVDRRKIELTEPLKVVGDYTVNIKLYQDILASPKIKVSPK